VKEWDLDIGHGRIVKIQQRPPGFRAALDGFHGQGYSIKTALDDLLLAIQKHNEAADDFLQATAPGGRLDNQVKEISGVVDQIVAKRKGLE